MFLKRFSQKTSVRVFFETSPESGGMSRAPERKVEILGGLEKIEQERQSSEKGAKLGMRLVQATENNTIVQEKLIPKINANLDQNATTAYMFLYPGDTQTNPSIAAKIRIFIENPENLAILQKVIEENGDIVELKEKIGLPVVSNPQSSMIRGEQLVEMSVDPNKKKDEGTTTSPSEEEKKFFLQSVEETRDMHATRQEADIEFVVAKREYENWINEHTREYVPNQDNLSRQGNQDTVHNQKGDSHHGAELVGGIESERDIRWYRTQEDLGENAIDVHVIGDEGTGFYLVTEEDIRVDETGYAKQFSTKEQAQWAERRYELYSEPPLDEIRGMGPDYIDTIKQIPEIQSLWKLQNPDEPFTAKGLRRLLLVGLLKKILPEEYQNLSYNQIVHHQDKSLTEQFQRAWEWNPIPGIRNTGKEGISKILTIVKDSSIWKNESALDKELKATFP